MVYYKPVKVTINALELAKVIIDVVMCHHDLPDSIISNRRAILRLSFGIRSITFSALTNDFQLHSTLK